VADQAVAPLISQFEMVTRLEAELPRTMCWRAMRSVVTWSTHTRSAPFFKNNLKEDIKIYK